MDSPELDPEGNGLVDGELTTSHHPLLIMGKEDSRTGTSGKKGFYEVNGNTFTEEEEDFVGLVYGKYEKLPVKDFGSEVRALRDVENFLDSTLLLLDLQTTGLQDILSAMIHKLKESRTDTDEFSVKDAMDALLTQDSAHVLQKTIQGITMSDGSGSDFDQSWLCVLCELPSLSSRHVVVSRLRHPANLGSSSQEVQFIILIVAPTKEKSTKTALEMGRTFSTLFADLQFRYDLQKATTEYDFKKLLRERTRMIIREHSLPENRKSHMVLTVDHFEDDDEQKTRCPLGRGMLQDLQRRIPHYFSDFKDGIIGNKTPQKVTSTVFFLYFACVLPNIAFGMLNDNNTDGAIGVKKILFSQSLGGILFALLGGQPLIVLLTTAPLALYTKIIYSICQDFDLDFTAMFACVGLWNCFFLLLYSFTNLSKMMKFSTRSTEEIFSMFITFAFTADAIKDAVKDFNHNFYTPACHGDISNHLNSNQTPEVTAQNISVLNSTTPSVADMTADVESCLKENSILFLLLMLGTVWVGITLYNFTQTPFLTTGKRELLADYALPAAVLIMSFFGSYVFREINRSRLFQFSPRLFSSTNVHSTLRSLSREAFSRRGSTLGPDSITMKPKISSYAYRSQNLDEACILNGCSTFKPFKYNPDAEMFVIAPLHLLPWPAILAAAGLGFSLSLLFFMDQNISSALVNNPANKLKKGAAYHWDLFTVAVINGFLSIFTFPWVHAALPHSPLHVKALADMEERVDQGHVHQIVVHVRETRLTGIISHIMIGLSMLLLPYPLSYIPAPVLDGLFLYVAFTALYGNQMFDRVLLFFTEQSAYPPNHYIRRVPQRKVHVFTVIQLVQLLVLCIFGFSPIPYMKMVFPILIMFLMPIRHKLVPKVIEPKYLKALDGH